MITLLHIKHDASSLERNAYIEAMSGFGPAERQREAIKLLLSKGLYSVAALIEGDDMEEAFEMTQNGVRSDSWSQRPPKGVVAVGGEGYHELNGKRYGYKSTSVGDIMMLNGEMYYVASFGFEKL